MLVQTWACKLSILFFALKTLGWGGGGAYPREQPLKFHLLHVHMNTALLMKRQKEKGNVQVKEVYLKHTTTTKFRTACVMPKYRILHGKCARTVFTHELWRIRNQTSERSERVRFLIQKNECVNTVQSSSHVVLCLLYTYRDETPSLNYAWQALLKQILSNNNQWKKAAS